MTTKRDILHLPHHWQTGRGIADCTASRYCRSLVDSSTRALHQPWPLRVGMAACVTLLGAGWALPTWAIPPTEGNPEVSPLEQDAPLSPEAWSFCTEQPLQSYLPRATSELSQTACHLLTFPTNTRSEREQFESQVRPGSLTHHTQPSSEEMTLPSMWWNRDSLPPRVGGHRLVDNWIGYTIQGTTTRIVDVTVSAQFWRALLPAERYGVVNKFGTSAQEFGYQLRFLQSNGYSARLVGVYVCEADVNNTPISNSGAMGRTCMVSVDGPQIVQLQRTLLAEVARVQQANAEAIPVAEVEALQSVDDAVR